MKNRNLKHSDNWKTPKSLYDKLNSEFNFTFDPCPYTEGEIDFNGLLIDWGMSNFVNPPYSRKLKEAFIKKGVDESRKGKLVVMLLPVSTSTKIFHEVILPNKKEIRFLKGRIAFEGFNTKGIFTNKNKGMHDSMIVVFDGRNNHNRKFIGIEKDSGYFEIAEKRIKETPPHCNHDLEKITG